MRYFYLFWFFPAAAFSQQISKDIIVINYVDEELLVNILIKGLGAEITSIDHNYVLYDGAFQVKTKENHFNLFYSPKKIDVQKKWPIESTNLKLINEYNLFYNIGSLSYDERHVMFTYTIHFTHGQTIDALRYFFVDCLRLIRDIEDEHLLTGFSKN